MGAVTEQARSKQRKRIANTSKKTGKRKSYWLITIAGLIAMLAVGGVFYLNQKPSAVTLSIGSGPYRSDSYELVREIADVVSRHSDWLTVSPQPTRDSSQNIRMLNEKQVDAATIRSDTPVANNVRLIANLFPDYFQLITRGDKPIYKVTDLIEKRIAIPSFGTDEFRSFWIIGDHYDLPINAVKWAAMDFTQASRKLLSGELDAIFTVRSLRDRLLLNLFEDAELKNEALRFIPINQAEAIAIKRPFLDVGNVPKGAFLGKGPTPSIDTITATVDRLFVTRDDLDQDIIREITRVLFEHRLDLTIRFSLASAIKKPDVEVGSGIPLHEGSQQYYNRDEPSFIQENAEPLALLVTVMAMLGSSLFAMRSRWESTQKDQMDTYNYVLLDIADAARKSESYQEIQTLKADLFANLEKAVIALDTDEMTEKGFQSYSLLWESVREIVNDRLADIKQATSKPKKARVRTSLKS